MRRKSPVREYAVFFLAIFFCSLIPLKADTFFGTAATGLVELPEYRYPVFLYVPKNYKPDRDYPLIITIPDVGQSPEEHMEYWTGWARRRSMLVLSPTNLWPDDVPYNMDRWIQGIIEDVMRRYRVDQSRVFLSGSGSGAHYAAYLGVNYPEYFSAAVLLNGAWNGQFEQLLRPSSRAVKQLPFLVVALGDEPERLERIEKKAFELEDRGYPITLMKVKDAGQLGSDAFKKKALEWLQEHADAWQRVIRERQKSWKEKTLTWFEKFFQVN